MKRKAIDSLFLFLLAFSDLNVNYSTEIADGIRDGNVLGFDTTKILTYKDKELRKREFGEL